jgi:hypothetical protein
MVWVDWMRTASYIATLRLIGAVSLMIGIMGVYQLGKHLLG